MLLVAALVAVVVFLPPEGRLMAPLHDGLALLFGRATFLLPLGLAFAGVVLFVRRQRPQVRLPNRRLAGVGLMLAVVLAGEHLLSNGQAGSGLVGEWIAGVLLDMLGPPVTVLLLLILLAIGTLLTFDVRRQRDAAS